MLPERALVDVVLPAYWAGVVGRPPLRYIGVSLHLVLVGRGRLRHLRRGGQVVGARSHGGAAVRWEGGVSKGRGEVWVDKRDKQTRSMHEASEPMRVTTPITKEFVGGRSENDSFQK